MDKVEKYYNYIVDHMINNTETYLNPDGDVGIKFPQYPDIGFYYYEEEEIEEWIEHGWWNIGTDDRNYLINVFGTKENETDIIINRYVKKLSQIILDKYY